MVVYGIEMYGEKEFLGLGGGRTDVFSLKDKNLNSRQKWLGIYTFLKTHARQRTLGLYKELSQRMIYRSKVAPIAPGSRR